METPLLASSHDDDDDGNEGLRPALVAHSSSSIRDDQEESEFSRLIAQRSSAAFAFLEQEGRLLDPRSAAAEWSHLDASSPFTPSTSRIFTSLSAAGQGLHHKSARRTVPVRGEWGVVAASTCFAMFVAFAGTTYTASTWTQAYLQVKSPLVHSELKLSAVGLADWISVSMSLSWVLWVILPIVTLVLPCAFLFFAPSWILVDGTPHQVISIERRILHPCFFRSTLELGMRWCLLLIYLAVLQDSIFLRSQWEGSDVAIRITSQHAVGFSALLLASMASLGVIMFLRAPPRRIDFDTFASQSADRTVGTRREEKLAHQIQPSVSNDASRFSHLRTPPRHAFQHLSSRSDRLHLQDEDEEEEYIVPLEESHERPSPDQPSPAGNGSNSSTSTPDLVDEDAIGGDEPDNLHSRNGTGKAGHHRSLSTCRKVLVFELGLVTLVMWMPILYTPWLSLRVETAASESKAILNWSNALFSNAWEQGVRAHTDTWLLVTVAVIMIAQLVVVPFLASVLGILVWLGEGSWCSRSRQWLYCLQPAMGGVVFSAAMLLLLRYQGSVLPPLTGTGATSAWDKLASAFAVCHQNLQEGELGPCALETHVDILTGGRFYVVHSLLIEVFVHLTLRWSLM